MDVKIKPVLLVPLLVAVPVISHAQKVIHGRVQSAASVQVLSGANIFIKHTYLGTVTNRNGYYSLAIPDSLLPVTVRVSYIGYTSAEYRITKESSDRQYFKLKSSVHRLKELVVTGSNEDPGMQIMREVIKHKEKWRGKLKSYEAVAYSRQNLSRDTTIAMIAESVAKEYWSKERGSREILKWHHQTANIQEMSNFSVANSFPNFYDDNIEIAGFKLVGITNPDAFTYYKFKLLGQLSKNGQTVYHIKVIPKKVLQPLFKGSVYVLDKKYALLKVNLVPNSVVRFPPPIQHFHLSYRQQFSNYSGPFWLPVGLHVSGSVKISMIGLHFPAMRFNQLIAISQYKINVPLPDSLYASHSGEYIRTVDISRDSVNEAFSIKPIPLSHKEQHAYATLDSSQTLEKQFQPTGFLAKLLKISSESDKHDDRNHSAEKDSSGHSGKSSKKRFHIPGEYWPLIRYNRVDGLFAGLKYSHDLVRGLELTARGGYSTAAKIGSYGANVQYDKKIGRFSVQAGGGYRVHNPTQYHSQTITPLLISLPNLLGYENYFDYFREKAWNFSAGFTDSRSNLSLGIGFKTAKQTSLKTNTAYDILGQRRVPRINPAINEGRLNVLTFTAGYNFDENYTFGIIGRKRIAFRTGISRPSLGSDFNFNRYSVHLNWSFPTFLKRRIFPNTLNISLDAGTFSGHLPIQKMGIVDVAPDIISPFGALRATRFRPYQGSSYVSLNMEHDFRTVPFELLGLNFLVHRNIGLIAFAGVAKTWLSTDRKQQIFQRTSYVMNTTDGVHLEAGLSLTGIFDLFRVDFAKRLDKPAFLIGVGLTRFR
jgi:hypothetical protein